MDVINKLVEQFILLNKKMKRWQRAVSVLSAVIVFVTTYALILPAITLDKETATEQPGIEVAAGENNAEESGTVFESEEEPEETAAEEPAGEEGSESEGNSDKAGAEEPEDVAEEADGEESSAGDLSEETKEEPSQGDGEEDERRAESVTDAEPSDDSDMEETAAGETVAADPGATDAAAEEFELITEDTQLTFKGKDYTVFADFGASAKLPVGVQLDVKEITKEKDPELYEAYYNKALEEIRGKYDENTQLSFAKFYDITFKYEETVIEPSGDVKVRIEYKKAVEVEEDTNVEAVHFDDPEDEEQEIADVKAKVLDEEKVEADRNETEMKGVEFESDKFSVYGIVGTAMITAEYMSVEGEKYFISVDCGPEAKIPEGSELKVEEILPEDGRYAEYYSNAIAAANGSESDEADPSAESAENSYARFFDITIMNGEETVEPKAAVKVEIRLADTPETEDAWKVVHFDAAGPVVVESENVVTDEAGAVEMAFDTDGFSVYGVITVPTAQPDPAVTDLDGKPFTISHDSRYATTNITPIENNSNVNGFGKTSSVSRAAIWYFEHPSGASSNTYYIYTLNDAGEKRYINLSKINNDRASASLTGNPQPFTVTRDGNIYRLSTQSNGTTYYLDEHNGNSGDAFAGWRGATDNGRLTLGFSNQPVMQDGDPYPYMTLVKYEGKYYIVNNDCSLTEVKYDEARKTVEVDDPMLWTISKNDSTGHIYFNSTEAGFNENRTASDWYRRYLDPTSQTGYLEETNKPGPGHVEIDAGTQHTYQGITYYEHKITDRRNVERNTTISIDNSSTSGSNLYNIYHGNNYLGVVTNPDGTLRLAGQQPSDNAAEILFASPTSVKGVHWTNHTVDHIDISINGTAKVNVPLAYGKYYGSTAGDEEDPILTVTENRKIELSEAQMVDRDQLRITADDMKRATITATRADNGTPIDDAFYITGYSGNVANGGNTNEQVRIEGSFMVADLRDTEYEYVDTNQYFGYSPDANQYTRRVNAARKDNIVEYTVSVVKPLTYNLIDPDLGQLYDAEGNALTITVDVAFSASFNYWDENNECPAVNGATGFGGDAWQRGGIDPSNLSGMDFVLGGDAEDPNSPLVALEITKVIMDEEGNRIELKEPVTNYFDIYQKLNASDDEKKNAVQGLHVTCESDDHSHEWNADNRDSTVHNGYEYWRTKRLKVDETGSAIVFDFDAKDGMYYIEEKHDSASLPDLVEDKSGELYGYVKTYIETEYVRRDLSGNIDEYSNKGIHPNAMHITEDFSSNNEHYWSIPEVAGKFTTLDGQSKKEAFLEFYVYNIYKPVEPVDVPINKKWADFVGDDYTWTATFQMEYIEQLVEEESEDPDNAHPVTTWTSIGEPFTISKSSTEEERTVKGLPKYRYDGYGNKYVRIYSASETAYEVKRVSDDTVVCSYDGTSYYPEGTEYRPAWEHDANEHNDGDYELRVHNVIHEITGGKETDVKITKHWEGDDEAIKAQEGTYATFTLKRTMHDEHIDWNGVDPDADDITVTLVVGDIHKEYYVKPNQQLWVVGNFKAREAGNVGQVDFKEGSASGNTITSLYHYWSDSEQQMRSAAFRVSRNTTIVCARNDLNCFVGGADGVELTTRGNPETPVEDSTFSETFTLDQEHGWSKYWDDLPKEVHHYDASSNQETITVYDYYMEEVDSNPKGYGAVFTRTEEDDLVDFYAVNKQLDEFKVVKNWWNAEDKDMPGIVYELYRQNRNNDGNPQGEPVLMGTYLLSQDGGFELNTETHLISDNKQMSETPWSMSHYVDTDPGEPMYFFQVKETGVYVPATTGANAGSWSVVTMEQQYVRIENSANPGKNGDNNYKDGRTGWKDAALDPWRDHTQTPQLTIRNTMNPYTNQIHLIKRWRDFTSSGGVSDFRNPNYYIKIQMVRRLVRMDTNEVVEEKVYGYPVTLKCENAQYSVETSEPIAGTGEYSHDLGDNTWGEWHTDGNGEWHYLQHNTDAEALPHYGYYYDSDGTPYVAKYEYTFAETEARCDFDGDGEYETNWIERILFDGDSTQAQDSTVYLMDNFKTSKIILRKKWYGTVDADYVLFSLVDDKGNDWGEIIHNYIQAGGRDYSFFGIEEKNLIKYNDHWYIAVYPDELYEGNWTLTLEGIPYLWIDNNADGCHEQEYDITEAYIHDNDGYHEVSAEDNILYTAWYRGTTKDEPQLSNDHAHVQMGRDDENENIDTTTTVITSNVTDTELEVKKEWYIADGEKIDTTDGTDPTVTVGDKVYTVDKVEYVLKVSVSNHDGSNDPESPDYETEGYLTGTFDSETGMVTANESSTGGLILNGSAAGAVKVTLDAGEDHDWKQIIKGLPSAHIFDRGSDFSGVRYYTETYEYEVEEYKVYGHSDSQTDVDLTRYFTKSDPTVTEAETAGERDEWTMSNKAEETGAVKVTKTFGGDVAELPDGFKITATWKDGAGDTGNDKTKELTVANADSGDGNTEPYTWVIDNLPLGNTVTFVEEGYVISGYGVQVTINGTAATDTPEAIAIAGDPDTETDAIAAFDNRYEVYEVDIDIIKVNEKDKSKKLPKAIFQILKYDGTEYLAYNLTTGTYAEPGEEESSKLETGADGKITFEGLTEGRYKIVEAKAPDGYNKTIDNDIYITYANGVLTWTDSLGNTLDPSQEHNLVTYSAKTATAHDTFTVGNEPGVVLPQAGGPGTILYTLGGFMLIALSALMYGFRMRRMERRLN